MRPSISSWARSIDDAEREPRRRLSARVRRQGHGGAADRAATVSHEAGGALTDALDRAAGWISDRIMAEVAEVLGLTPAYVKGVVTFYTMYHQHPVGKNFVQVCTTSPCNICGAEAVMKALLEQTGAEDAGATSPDGKWTIVEVECLGACGFATPILVNDDFLENVTPEKVPEIVKKYR
ncbi:MAG: NADH-quinone oxidoreductase subunit E [Gemmatimonadetes bacterium]|nr:MAG: NADH-quinone oxidoreductase subunit E [Gemmatimonadota bacterium]